MNNGNEDVVNTLVYDGHEPRIYEKDDYDPRVDLGRDREKEGPIPYFNNARQAIYYMLANPGKQCQLDVRTKLMN
jgi:hypothetical protein